jgi:hypothetical protein
MGHKSKCRKCNTHIDVEFAGRGEYEDVVESQYSKAFCRIMANDRTGSRCGYDEGC